MMTTTTTETGDGGTFARNFNTPQPVFNSRWLRRMEERERGKLSSSEFSIFTIVHDESSVSGKEQVLKSQIAGSERVRYENKF